MIRKITAELRRHIFSPHDLGSASAGGEVLSTLYDVCVIGSGPGGSVAAATLHRAATEHVENRADVIVNFRDGYYAGSRLLDVFTFLRATHGNIGREQSLGFVSDTERDLPAYLRAEGVWTVLGDPVINRRAPSAK